MSLADKKCVPCQGGVPAIQGAELAGYLRELPEWQLVDGKKLRRTVKLKNFAEALALANTIGALAEEEGHHPDLLVRWGELGIDLWTHKIDGLSESDFILAAKIDRALPN